MIKGFEEYTKPLTETELVQADRLAVIFKSRRGRWHPSMSLCQQLYMAQTKANQAKIRNMVHHIRVNDLLSCLIASGKGYKIAETRAELETYLEGLHGRINSQQAALDAVIGQAALRFQQHDMFDGPAQQRVEVGPT